MLIVWHTQFGCTGQTAAAAIAGACSIDDDVVTVAKRAHEADADDLLVADALLFGCSENFGGMAATLEDFLERVDNPHDGRDPGGVAAGLW